MLHAMKPEDLFSVDFGMMEEEHGCPCGHSDDENYDGPRQDCTNPSCIHPGGRRLPIHCFKRKNSAEGDPPAFRTCSHCRAADAAKKRKRRLQVRDGQAASAATIAALQAELANLNMSHTQAVERISSLEEENTVMRQQLVDVGVPQSQIGCKGADVRAGANVVTADAASAVVVAGVPAMTDPANVSHLHMIDFDLNDIDIEACHRSLGACSGSDTGTEL